MRVEAKRKNITQPEDWWLAFEEEADRCGMTLAGWIGDCCWANLPKGKQSKLSGRQPAHRPPAEDE